MRLPVNPQMIVGATLTADKEILQTSIHCTININCAAYIIHFSPIRMQTRGRRGKPALIREQAVSADWMLRFYKFKIVKLFLCVFRLRHISQSRVGCATALIFNRCKRNKREQLYAFRVGPRSVEEVIKSAAKCVAFLSIFTAESRNESANLYCYG